jgi:hypothetical protein
MLLMPRVLEEIYGEPVPTTVVQLLDMKSVDRDLDLVVRHVVSPRISEEYGDFARLARPPTRVLIAVDPEKRFATRALQRLERSKLVQRLFESLPNRLRTPAARDELESLVEVTTWGTLPWEFANFTDAELAAGILSCVPHPSGVTRAQVVAALQSERTTKQRRSPNIDRVYASWPQRPRKVEVAEALWPRLQAKIVRANESNQRRQLPAHRVGIKALEMAMGSARRSVALRLR